MKIDNRVLLALPMLFLLAGCGREGAPTSASARSPLSAGGGGAGSPAFDSFESQRDYTRGGMHANPSAPSTQPKAVSSAALGGMAVQPSQPMDRFANPHAMAKLANPIRQRPNFYINSTYMGGTGAKDRMEKLIAEGVMVEGKRVKLEAFSRSYGQAFPIPSTEALAVVADTDHAKIVQQGDHTFLQVGIQALKGEAPRRPPLNVALVIDRSGSMNEAGKLEYAKTAAARLVDQLHDGDVFSLAVFDDQARVLAPAITLRGRADRARLRATIESIQTGGGTNIYDGLRAGYAEARKHVDPNGLSRVILVSDGEVTSGVNDPAQFTSMARTSADAGIETTSVGVGVEYNEDLMMAIAREGRGNYHFMKDGGDTQQVFSKELNELSNVVAKAVKLRILLANGVSLVRVLGASALGAAETRDVKAQEKRLDRKVADELGIAANRQKEPDEPGIKLFIPSFYRGDNHIVMIELAIPPGLGSRKVADVFLKYKDLTRLANREARASSQVAYTGDRAEAIASLNRGVKKNLLGFQTGEALAEAGRLMEAGRIPEAVKRIDERMVVLGTAARQWGDRDLDRDGRLLDRYKSVLAQLGKDRMLAGGEFGQYLKRSLTYAGYQMTR